MKKQLMIIVVGLLILALVSKIEYSEKE